MSKVFHLILFGMTALVAGRSSHAQSFDTMNGQLSQKTYVSTKTLFDGASDPIASASFCESGPDRDNGCQSLGNSCGK